MSVVHLTVEEMEFAALAGSLRRARALANGLQDRYGKMDTDPWSNDIEGVAAELLVAKTLNRYYVPALSVQPRGSGDVGSYEVRSTQHEHGCLLIKDGDPDKAFFVLVIGSAPRLRVVGWIQAVDGKRAEWRRTVRGRSAWFVPQDALKPLNAQSKSLPGEVAA